MGYYNWGEQIGNSFMSMFAQNQQKRLEEKRIGMEQQRLQQSQMQLDDQLKTGEQQRSLLGMQIGELEKTNKFWGGIPDVAQRLSDTNNDGIYNDLDTPTMVPAQFAHLTKGLSWDPYQLKSFNNGKWQEDTQWYRGDQAENFLNIYMKNQENAAGTWEGQQDRINSTKNAQINANANLARLNFEKQVYKEGESERKRLQLAADQDFMNKNWSKFSNTLFVDANGTLRYFKDRGVTKDAAVKLIQNTANELGVTYEYAKSLIANSLTTRAGSASQNNNDKWDPEKDGERVSGISWRD